MINLCFIALTFGWNNFYYFQKNAVFFFPVTVSLHLCVPVSSDRSMSSIYSDPQWSANMDTAVSRLSGPGVELGEALAWINERSKDEYFSLTDVWGVLTSAGIMKQVSG